MEGFEVSLVVWFLGDEVTDSLEGRLAFQKLRLLPVDVLVLRSLASAVLVSLSGFFELSEILAVEFSEVSEGTDLWGTIDEERLIMPFPFQTFSESDFPITNEIRPPSLPQSEPCAFCKGASLFDGGLSSLFVRTWASLELEGSPINGGSKECVRF